MNENGDGDEVQFQGVKFIRKTKFKYFRLTVQRNEKHSREVKKIALHTE